MFNEKLDVMIGKLCNLHYQLGCAETNEDFDKSTELAEKIADEADMTLSIPRLMTEVRMEYYDIVAAIDKKIDNAIIQE